VSPSSPYAGLARGLQRERAKLLRPLSNDTPPPASSMKSPVHPPPENVFGHSKKLRLLLEDIDGRRRLTEGALRILDVGCGNGAAVTRYLGNRGDKVLGIDTHRPSIDWARAHYGSPDLEFEVTPAESLPTGKRFDVITLADILEHVEGPDRLLTACAQRLLPEGRVLVTIPNGFGPFEIESRLSRVRGLGWLGLRAAGVLNRLFFSRSLPAGEAESECPPYNEESGHLHFFTFRRFLAIAESAGLRLERRRCLSWICGPYTNTLLARSTAFCNLNVRVADRLPIWMVSAWYFCLRSAPEGPDA